MKELSDQEKHRRGGLIAGILGVKYLRRSARYRTQWGDKNALGIYETVKRLNRKGRIMEKQAQTVPQLSLLDQAEEARKAGNRELCLKLKNDHEAAELAAKIKRHKERVEEVKKEWPVGSVVLGHTVEAITDGHGTQSGWIAIKLAGVEKTLKPHELRAKIHATEESKRIDRVFRDLVYHDRKDIFIGQYDDDGLSDLMTYMELDRVSSPREVQDQCYDFPEAYRYGYDQAIEDGRTDEEAEEAGLQAEDEARDKDYWEYRRKILTAINYVLEYGGLKLVEKDEYRFFLEPLTSWKKAADKTAALITDYGTFEFKSGQELVDGGPYGTFCEAVIRHLHWLKKGPEIYGDRSYDYIFR